MARVALAATSPAPTPTSTVVTPGFGPTPGGSGDVGASAGLYAFLIVLGLILVTVVIFISMDRSLKRARANLGGSILPRREADRLPVSGLDDRSLPPTTRDAERAPDEAPPPG